MQSKAWQQQAQLKQSLLFNMDWALRIQQQQ
jgi:hypothetical protein